MSTLLQQLKEKQAGSMSIKQASPTVEKTEEPATVPAFVPKTSKVEYTLTADQVGEHEFVMLQGVRAECLGRQSDGRIVFKKEGNLRNTIVPPETIVEETEQPSIAQAPSTQAPSTQAPSTQAPSTQEIVQELPPKETVFNAPAVQEKNIVTQSDIDMPFLLEETIRTLFKDNPELLNEALEEDELPEARTMWPEIVMKECMNAKGESAMLFGIQRGAKIQFVSNQISGIIIFTNSTKIMYPGNSKPNDKVPPLCWSDNSKVPYGGKFYSKSCVSCPYNEFGSSLKGAKGKACADRIKLYLYIPEMDDVFLLDISPKSIKIVSTYFNNLKTNNPPINYRTVETSFTCSGVYDGKTTPYGVISEIQPEALKHISLFQKAMEARVRLKDLMAPKEPPQFPLKQTTAQESQVTTLE